MIVEIPHEVFEEVIHELRLHGCQDYVKCLGCESVYWVHRTVTLTFNDEEKYFWFRLKYG